MSDPFHSSKYSIEHAKRRLRELEGEISVFFKTDPYARVIEFNTDRVEDAHKVKLVKPMPVGLPGIAFDVVSSLRSALDQVGYAVAVAAGNSGRDAHFPFGPTFADVESRRTRRSKDIHKDIFDLMVSFKPYKGGDDLLWALNQLCNSHKHEIVTPVAMSTGSTMLNHANFQGLIALEIPPRWDRAKNEMILVRVRHGTRVDYDFQIQMFIAMAEVDVVDGQPADAVLNTLVGKVEGIILTIEAESRRIGIIK